MLRRFDFFSRSLVTSDGIALDFRTVTPQQTSHDAFKERDFICSCAGYGKFILGDSEGGITVMGSNTLRPRRYQLIEELICTIQVIKEVIAVVSISTLSVPQIRFYELPSSSDIESEEQPKLLHRSLPKRKDMTQLSSLPTCSAFSEDVKNFALGFKDGGVLWIHSLNIKDGSESILWLMPSLGPSSMIGICTGLAFTIDNLSLWVAYEKRCSIFDRSGHETVLDREEGCKLGCATIAPDPSFFVLAKQDRVAFYLTETPGSCYSILGGREKICKCRGNLALVSLGEVWKGLNMFASPSSSSAKKKDIDQEQKQTLQIFDLNNKFIGHEFPLWRDENDVCHFLSGDDETGSVFILTKKRRLWKLQEKTLEFRLAELLKRNLYETAANLAKSSNCEPAFIADIYRKYGDHLYDKGNFDDSIAQYVRTVGKVEPSYVIRKFLDPPRVKNLTAYLETLHHVGFYKDAWNVEQQKLEVYSDPNKLVIPTYDHTTLLLTCYAKLKDEEKINQLLSNPEAKIDVDAALQVLKETGRLDPALRLAKEKSKISWFVKTLLELSDYQTIHHAQSALSFIRDTNNVQLFKEFGGNILSLILDAGIDCVKYWIEKGITTVEDMVDCFADYPEALESLCRHAISLDQEIPWIVYFELCLTHRHFDAALEVLHHPRVNLDSNEALSTLRRFNFRKGELLFYEKSQQWDLLLKAYLDDNEDSEIILNLAKTRLGQHSDTWITLLRYFSSKPVSVRRDACIRDALSHIEQHNVLPPILALRVLSEKPDSVQLGVVRRYLISQIQRATRQSDADNQEVKQLREETEKMRNEAHSLISEPRIFNSTNCSMTGAPLELPVIHFYSGNSYNLISLPAPTSSDKFEDPKLAQDQNSILEIARGLDNRRQNVDEEFFSDLQFYTGESGFNYVADYFGKCLFDEE